jgi:CheY-like chemotaxis protein
MKPFDSVCVIDDDIVYRFALRCLLETWDLGDNFSEFTDGAEALRHIKANAHNAAGLPDVLFLDINMPVMNGFNFLDEYGKIKDSLAKDIRIYLVSASIADETRARAQNHPLVNGYIIKPLPVEALQEIMMEAA